jgi:hypothetical protein
MVKATPSAKPSVTVNNFSVPRKKALATLDGKGIFFT